MKRNADGNTTIRVLMDNKASKNSGLHRAIIETGRFKAIVLLQLNALNM